MDKMSGLITGMIANPIPNLSTGTITNRIPDPSRGSICGPIHGLIWERIPEWSYR
jgi:hypothetical protein